MERNRQVDICKGFLIWFVILGHAGFQSMEWLHNLIFWFHMPCFFILTGFLTNWDKYSLREFMKKRFRSYMIPYFIFSILLILIYQDWFKGIIKMIVGGRINTSCYSYPFWFITALFISTCIYKFIMERLNIKREIVICVCMWFAGHIIAFFSEIPTLPWGGEYVLVIIPYLFIGRISRENMTVLGHEKKNVIIIIGIISSFIIVQIARKEVYLLNIKSYNINHIIFDMLIPISVLYIIFEFSLLINNHCRVVALILQKIGMSSMVIYYIHAMLLDKISYFIGSNIEIEFRNFLYLGSSFLILFIGILLYTIFSKFQATNKLFLGNW